MSISWGKRLEYRLLRWQARFEGAVFDRTFPWIAGCVIWIIFILLALAKSRELSQTSDFAAVMQSVWLIAEGYTPESSLLGQNYLASQGGFSDLPHRLAYCIIPNSDHFNSDTVCSIILCDRSYLATIKEHSRLKGRNKHNRYRYIRVL